ncbi:hypothetical protein DMC30DRAFT_449684, partial [Rhodotorula diobovata]
MATAARPATGRPSRRPRPAAHAPAHPALARPCQVRDACSPLPGRPAATSRGRQCRPGARTRAGGAPCAAAHGVSPPGSAREREQPRLQEGVQRLGEGASPAQSAQARRERSRCRVLPGERHATVVKLGHVALSMQRLGHGLHARRRTRHCRATGPVRALHRAASACHARGRGRGARRGGAGEGGRRGCRRCWRAAAEVDLPRGRVLRLSRRVTRAVRARSASARPNLPKRALSRPLSQLAVAPLSSTAALPCVHFALERSSQSSHASASARGGTGDPARLGGLLPTGTPASAASSCPDRASAHCAAADGRGRAESGDVGAEVGEGAVRARTAATDVS